MFASIQVKLPHNRLESKERLYEIAKEIYPLAEQPDRDVFSQGPERYIEDLYKFSIYTCIPHPSSQAIFLWHDNHFFELVVRSFHQENLLRISTRIVDRLREHFLPLGTGFEVAVEIRSPDDSRTYIAGKNNLLWSRMKEELKDNIVALVIGVIIAIISYFLLDQFFQESIVGILSLLLFTTWEIYSIWESTRRISIHWSIDEQGIGYD
jgi:hypothetical protein